MLSVPTCRKANSRGTRKPGYPSDCRWPAPAIVTRSLCARQLRWSLPAEEAIRRKIIHQRHDVPFASVLLNIEFGGQQIDISSVVFPSASNSHARPTVIEPVINTALEIERTISSPTSYRRRALESPLARRHSAMPNFQDGRRVDCRKSSRDWPSRFFRMCSRARDSHRRRCRKRAARSTTDRVALHEIDGRFEGRTSGHRSWASEPGAFEKPMPGASSVSEPEREPCAMPSRVAALDRGFEIRRRDGRVINRD